MKTILVLCVQALRRVLFKFKVGGQSFDESIKWLKIDESVKANND